MPLIASDVATADRMTCPECGHECDLGDCDLDEDGDPRCPVCYTPMEVARCTTMRLSIV